MSNGELLGAVEHSPPVPMTQSKRRVPQWAKGDPPASSNRYLAARDLHTMPSKSCPEVACRARERCLARDGNHPVGSSVSHSARTARKIWPPILHPMLKS